MLVGGLYALFATGLSLAFGVMRFVNLAHGDLAVLAAYFVVSWVRASVAITGSRWSLVVIVMAGRRLHLRSAGMFNRTIGADPLPGILATFGLGIVIQNALQEHYTATDKVIPLGDIRAKSIQLTDDCRSAGSRCSFLSSPSCCSASLQLFLSFTRSSGATSGRRPTIPQDSGIDGHRRPPPLRPCDGDLVRSRRAGRVLQRCAHAVHTARPAGCCCCSRSRRW